MISVSVYRQRIGNSSRYWGILHEGGGEYIMTTRGYTNPVTAVRQLFSNSNTNKAYAGRRQHVNQFLNAYGMRNSKVNTRLLRELIQQQDPNLLNRIRGIVNLYSIR
jgi:hypothetical protein